MARAIDLVSTVEAAYESGDTDEEWLRGIMTRLSATIPGNLGLVGFGIGPGPGSLTSRISVTVPLGCGSAERWLNDARTLHAVDSPRFERIMRKVTCDTMSHADHEGPLFDAWVKANRDIGARDGLFVNAFDPNRGGCAVSAILPRKTRLSPAAKAAWTHLSVHLSAGWRLRQQLAGAPGGLPSTTTGAEAILEPSGTVAHAEPAAQSGEARDALRRAARRLDAIRGPLRLRDPTGALAEWKGLIAARWTLLDHFDTDGRHYLVARRNDAPVDRIEDFSHRERQVAIYAALGRTNKLIAYELGLAQSTVRVLLARAAAKLRVQSRRDLCAIVAAALAAGPRRGTEP
jgi:DNA-binding CsgD family transcriptional regulator